MASRRAEESAGRAGGRGRTSRTEKRKGSLMKRRAILMALATTLLLFAMSASALAAPAIKVIGTGQIPLITFPDWDTVTGWARVTISARSVGEPEMIDGYDIYQAVGFVRISVADAGLETAFRADVKELFRLGVGVHGVSIEYELKGVRYSMYITDDARRPGASMTDYVWLGFVIPTLGDGHAYPARPVVRGDFWVR